MGYIADPPVELVNTLELMNSLATRNNRVVSLDVGKRRCESGLSERVGGVEASQGKGN